MVLIRMGSTRTVLDLEDSTSTKNCGLDATETTLTFPCFDCCN